MSDNRQIFTLEQVCTSIKKTIEARYNQLYWVKAEMHKINRYPSGHAFPELVQKEGDKIMAQMTGTIWKQNYERIDKQFISVVKEPLKEGSNLLMQVKVTYSEVFGLSLHIVDIDPNFSLGELQRERDETLKRLQKEGLTNLNQQLPFPLLPKRIAIISADSSKGLSDFMKVIEQNPWGYRFFTMLFPAYLQGDVAVASIQTQLERIEKVKEHFDCVAIVRGGGGEVGGVVGMEDAEELPVLQHTFSHYRLHMQPVLVRTEDDRFLEPLQAAGATEVVPGIFETPFSPWHIRQLWAAFSPAFMSAPTIT